jgi:hypothetical protein
LQRTLAEAAALACGGSTGTASTGVLKGAEADISQLSSGRESSEVHALDVSTTVVQGLQQHPGQQQEFPVVCQVQLADVDISVERVHK